MESSQALVVEETGRRKRPRNGGDEEGSLRRRRLNAWEDDGRVVEEEVEEFFAILRRMHDAVTWFSVKKKNASSNKWREERDGRKGWKPKFLMEDFEAASSVKRKAHTDDEGGRTAERVAEKEIHGCLDLNAEPTPERNVVILP